MHTSGIIFLPWFVDAMNKIGRVTIWHNFEQDTVALVLRVHLVEMRYSFIVILYLICLIGYSLIADELWNCNSFVERLRMSYSHRVT
jgi:hypothetical protein